jgi:uncharacterized protein YegL
MNTNLTDLTLVVDRSGSMVHTQKDAEGGIETLIAEQKKQAGDCVVSLVQFDGQYDPVYTGVAIKDVPQYSLVPRGNTALRDAVGRTILETGKRLSDMPEDQRPGLVVIAIITDGEENASREFPISQVAEMIRHQQDVYSWKFTFIGANQDAFAVGSELGIDRGGIANYNEQQTASVFMSMSSNVSRMRGAMGCCGPQGAKGVACEYTDEERKAMQ